jgi:hypothetical protein
VFDYIESLVPSVARKFQKLPRAYRSIVYSVEARGLGIWHSHGSVLGWKSDGSRMLGSEVF